MAFNFGTLVQSYLENMPVIGTIIKATELGRIPANVVSDLMNGSPQNNFALSLANKATQAGPTGLDVWQNETNRQNYQDRWKMDVAGMQEAGLNPALMYGGSSSGGSAPQVSPAAGSGLADLLSVITIPAQLKRLNAETDQIKANTQLVQQKTLTEEQETKLREISATFGYELTIAQINEMNARIADYYASVNLRSSQKDLIDNQSDAQWIANKYLDKKYTAEIANIEQSTAKMSAEERLDNAKTVYQNWLDNFVKDNDFLPSSNDNLMMATYIASLFGISKPDVTKILSSLKPKDSVKPLNTIKNNGYEKR